jgi:hypothetical protein
MGKIKHYRTPNLIQKERMETIKELITNGLTKNQIWQYVNKGSASREPWEVSQTWVSNLVRRAEVEIEMETQSHRPTEIAKAIRRLNLIFAQCLSSQNYTGCLNAQKELNELLGLKAPTLQQVDVTTKGQALNQPDYSKLTDEELRIMTGIQAKLIAPAEIPPTAEEICS